jgi:hypothetical protein
MRGIVQEAKVTSMKKQISIFRICAISVLGLAVFASAADAARMSSRQCRQEWKANKAAFKQEGKTRRTFMRACRAGTAPAAPAAPGAASH